MAKRISDIQRIISFAMAADEPTLGAAIESMQAIRASKFPKAAGKPRKSRKDKGTTRGGQSELPGTEEA